MIMASPHFSIDELTFSETATRHGIDNVANGNALDNLYKTARGMENVRTVLNDSPIYISSGYRCLDLNTILGSKPTSSHIAGLACDFTCQRFGSPREIVLAIIKSKIDYDQIILEYERWVHISFSKYKEDPKKQSLIITKSGTIPFK
tara:strand:+ start:110 stop:550 length:441 start_codon:yes stop_codon:yes gene_type:complete